MLKIPIRNFLILFFVVMSISILAGIMYKNYRSTFDAGRWKNNEEQRVHMIDDFLSKHKVKNMEKNEILKLLGKPTHSDFLKEKDTIVYFLGKEREFVGIDSEWLLISFDKDEKVSNYKIVKD